MAKYLLFDLDGTLTDPVLGITNSIMYMLRKEGREVPPREKLYFFIGPPLIPSFKEVFGMTDEEAKVALEEYREYFSTKGIFENEPYPGIADALDRLKKAGYVIGTATSKPEEFAEKILVHFDLRKYFDCVTGASMDEKRVSKSDVISDALERMGADRNETIMIGDRKHDVEGGQAQNIPTLGVLWGYGSRDELEAAGAKWIAETIGEMAEIIEKN